MPEQRIIKDGAIIDNTWTLIAKDATEIPSGNQLLIPLALWQAQSDLLKERNDIGVWFDSEEIPESPWAEALKALPLIAVNFQTFKDGRGFTIARLLRQRFGYSGEIRAVGHVLREQLCYLKRCGFNSFVLAEHINLNEALSSLNDFTEFYQTSVDQPEPLFRRL